MAIAIRGSLSVEREITSGVYHVVLAPSAELRRLAEVVRGVETGGVVEAHIGDHRILFRCVDRGGFLLRRVQPRTTVVEGPQGYMRTLADSLDSISTDEADAADHIHLDVLCDAQEDDLTDLVFERND